MIILIPKQAGSEDIPNPNDNSQNERQQLVSDLLLATFSLENELKNMQHLGLDAYKEKIHLSKFENAIKNINTIGKELSDSLFFSTINILD